jgi:hypothetical protein
MTHPCLVRVLQICELAWQQGIELYSHGDYALVTCMELHASINNGEKPCCCDYELKARARSHAAAGLGGVGGGGQLIAAPVAW